jgi:Resolvase, N terminal domain
MLALAAFRAGDTLVVTKLDRPARSLLPDASDILDELTRRHAVLARAVAALLRNLTMGSDNGSSTAYRSQATGMRAAAGGVPVRERRLPGLVGHQRLSQGVALKELQRDGSVQARQRTRSIVELSGQG